MSKKQSFESQWRAKTIAGVEVRTQGLPLSVAVKLSEMKSDAAAMIEFAKHIGKAVQCADGSPIPQEGLTLEVVTQLFDFAVGRDTQNPL